MAVQEPREVESGTTLSKARIWELQRNRRLSECKVPPLFGVRGCGTCIIILKYSETKMWREQLKCNKMLCLLDRASSSYLIKDRPT